MILMKIVPGIPGHFSGYDWLALGMWSGLGLGLAWRQRRVRVGSPVKEIHQ
jgi:CHASE2 domain-containing sensor protein